MKVKNKKILSVLLKIYLGLMIFGTVMYTIMSIVTKNIAIMLIFGLTSMFTGILSFIALLLLGNFENINIFKNKNKKEKKKIAWISSILVFLFIEIMTIFSVGLEGNKSIESNMSNQVLLEDKSNEEKIKQEELAKQEEEKKKQEELAKQEKEQSKPKRLLGANKEEIKELLAGYKINSNYQKNVDSKAIKFEDNSLIIVVDFDDNWLAEGVAFLAKDGDFLTGKGSYVDLHYYELIEFATGGEEFKIENNPATEYPMEVYIGNVH